MVAQRYYIYIVVQRASLKQEREGGMTVPKGDFWRVNRGGNFYRNVCDESLYTKYPTYLYHPGCCQPLSCPYAALCMWPRAAQRRLPLAMYGNLGVFHRFNLKRMNMHQDMFVISRGIIVLDWSQSANKPPSSRAK